MLPLASTKPSRAAGLPESQASFPSSSMMPVKVGPAIKNEWRIGSSQNTVGVNRSKAQSVGSLMAGLEMEEWLANSDDILLPGGGKTRLRPRTTRRQIAAGTL